MRSLVTRAKRICSKELLSEEINEIKKFAPWNGFPKAISTSIIKRALSKSCTESQSEENNETIKIYMNLPYLGNAGDLLVKKCIKTLKRNIRKETKVAFVVSYATTKVSFYTNTKDRIDKLANSFIVYEFCCPGCSKRYIGKTERTFMERINEHAYKDKKSVVYNHITNCDGVKDLVDLLNIQHTQKERDSFNKKVFSIETVKNNINIIDRARRWDILLFKEALRIKEKNPTLNSGLKASKELKLF